MVLAALFFLLTNTNSLINDRRNKWQEDQRKNIVNKLFWSCGGDIGADMNHWYFHSYNVSHEQFKIDVQNDFRCHH